MNARSDMRYLEFALGNLAVSRFFCGTLGLCSTLLGCGADESRKAPSSAETPAEVVVVPPTEAGMVKQIQQYGITWVFEEEVLAGKFVSGDWWVVGPVTIAEIQPEPTGTRHGTMLNPRARVQGYDARGPNYDASTQLLSFPAVVSPTTSVVSSVSKEGSENAADFQDVGLLQTQAVLTVLEVEPEDGAFRPAYAGTYKTLFNASDMAWDSLPRLRQVETRPSGSEIAGWVAMPHIDQLPVWQVQYMCAEDNWGRCYGREVADRVSEAALYVLLDTPHREAIAYGLVQRGIDNYGVLKAGGGFPLTWDSPGGHFSGRKFPIVFAAVLLNDPDLLGFDTEFSDEKYFQEDMQTYFGVSGNALWGSPCSSGFLPPSCSGDGAKDCRDSAGQTDGCPDYRTCCTSPTWVGQALSARIIGAESVWNHDAFFEYIDRWVEEATAGGDFPVSPWGGLFYGNSDFRREMWEAYRSLGADAR